MLESLLSYVSNLNVSEIHEKVGDCNRGVINYTALVHKTELTITELHSFQVRKMQDLPPAPGYLPRYDEDGEEDVRHLHVRAIFVCEGEGSLYKKTKASNETVGIVR